MVDCCFSVLSGVIRGSERVAGGWPWSERGECALGFGRGFPRPEQRGWPVGGHGWSAGSMLWVLAEDSCVLNRGGSRWVVMVGARWRNPCRAFLGDLWTCCAW